MSHAPPQLQPVNPPLGPQPQNAKLYSPHQAVLAMKEKVFSISGDDFTIKTAEGQDVCICKGKAISARGKKKFLDMQENELFTLENKMLALQKSFRGVSPSGHDFEITGKFKMMGSRSICTFKNASDGRQVEIEVKGDWLDKSAEILYEDKVVASISRKFFNAREFFGGSQTYFVAVAPNVDLSLIAALCVAIDEREND